MDVKEYNKRYVDIQNILMSHQYFKYFCWNRRITVSGTIICDNKIYSIEVDATKNLGPKYCLYDSNYCILITERNPDVEQGIEDFYKKCILMKDLTLEIERRKEKDLSLDILI